VAAAFSRLHQCRISSVCDIEKASSLTNASTMKTFRLRRQ